MKKLNFFFGVAIVATAMFNSCKDTNTPVKDEGVVINGIKWATRNVDKPGTFAATPESAGMFYQWNSNIGWSATDPLVSTDGSSWKYPWNGGSNTATWEAKKDPCPSGWRVPTQAEINSLANTESEWVSTPVEGRVFGSGNNTIFLSASGVRNNSDGQLNYVGHGYYWCSTYVDDMAMYAYYISLGSNNVIADGTISTKGSGLSVRCVAK